MEFEWNIFPGFNTLQLSEEVKSLLCRLGETPENFTERILFVSMFNDTSCGTKDNEEECLANARLVSLYARRLGKGQWSFIGLGSEKKWYSIQEDSPQGICAEICEEYESFDDRTVRPDKVMGQSILLSAIKTEVSLDGDDRAERIEKLSQQDKLSKFCMDAGSLNVVEIGQYFMTNDTGDLTQFHAVACGEYTLPREDEASQPKGWIQGNTKIGPVLEVATSYLHSKHGVEVRIMSLSRDNTHSWARISHGSNKFVMILNNNETENSRRSVRRICVKTECIRFCMPIEGKSKTTKKRTCLLFTQNRSH